ncbi:hypothetical protein CesoFtcFv8_015485 [Champsocephalus esox]|uniref:Uncharacterized protein n=1 Tax=Champsocephalus esox TaxID=159716 RepID=A0AAN8BR17_9TELE|nr:hypothetical protein CesoFtcFv8_015485 [Champsocephalus esox]
MYRTSDQETGLHFSVSHALLQLRLCHFAAIDGVQMSDTGFLIQGHKRLVCCRDQSISWLEARSRRQYWRLETGLYCVTCHHSCKNLTGEPREGTAVLGFRRSDTQRSNVEEKGWNAFI